MSDTPPASESLPIVRGVFRGVRGFVFAVVWALMIALLGVALSSGASLPGGPQWPIAILSIGLDLALAGQGEFLLGAGGRAPSGLLFWLLPIGIVALAVFAGYSVAFRSGGVRLERREAATFGALISVGWTATYVVLALSVPLALNLGVPVADLLGSAVLAAVFSAAFGAFGGVLANR